MGIAEHGKIRKKRARVIEVRVVIRVHCEGVSGFTPVELEGLKENNTCFKIVLKSRDTVFFFSQDFIRKERKKEEKKKRREKIFCLNIATVGYAAVRFEISCENRTYL